MSTYHKAVEYIEAGISVIPIACDGTKKQTLPSWNPYRERFASKGELVSWFSRPRGIAIVCGVLSGGLEVLDFDVNADENFDAWRRSLPAEIHGKLCVVETGGGGYHVPYRSDQVCGNVKIAMSEDGKQTFIESRGEGGYVVAVGSPAEVHKSGKPYAQVMGMALPEIPRFTLEERKVLWVEAAKLDKRDREKVVADYVKDRVKVLNPQVPEDFDTSTPWGDFDARANWYDILEPHGWTSTDGILWSRPGKDEPGTSAKVVLSKTTGVTVLTVFSSSAGVLAPSSGANKRTVGKFQAFALLNHGGDRKNAARAARSMGYGGSAV